MLSAPASRESTDRGGGACGEREPGRERTYILHLGDCVWVTVTDARFSGTPRQGESILGQLFARLEPDLGGRS